VNASFGVLLVCALATPAWAQSANRPLPRFEDYPVKQIYKGVPAAPKIITSAQRKYRTRIREGVEKGWGVYQDGKEQHHPGPNFAGKMVVVQWGCGAPCLMVAMVDGESGEVYLPPLSVDNTFALPLFVPGRYSVSSNPELSFRQDSRLLIMKATPDWSKENHHSYTYYFLWQNNLWSLIRQVRLKDDELP
jgi:hypothetical protein